MLILLFPLSAQNQYTADSKWGSVRAEMGHPEPFPLKYVEIGNEHPPAIYGDYYVKFREVIKAKYPDLTVIMSMYWSGLNQKAIDRTRYKPGTDGRKD